MQTEEPKTQNYVIEDITAHFPGMNIISQDVQDEVPTLWVDSGHVRDLLAYLKGGMDRPYRMLYDLCAVDERARRNTPDQPAADFSVVYHLLSFERNSDVRVKTPLKGEFPSIQTVTDLWKNANWYEREVWDMFGITVEGHPFLERILNPPWWVGHPLRKDQPARATEMPRFTLDQAEADSEEVELRIHPEKFGFSTSPEDDVEYMYLNLGPHHPGNHGLVRYALQLDGERINDSVVDIGWHHRGAEKMAERQTFHTYIPYTDRIDYLGGFQNELPYVLTVEKMAGIEVPEKSQVIRVMLAELFRIASHVVWFGTLAQDLGAMSPVFFTFTDRERVFEVIEAVAGGRMHPEWFRIGGVAADLPNGWKKLVDGFIKYFDPRITEYEKMMVKNSVFRSRTRGVGVYTTESAIDWGVTGPNLRTTGLEWDLRKKRPYSGYEKFDFEIPTATEGDSLARTVVRLAEMRQSLRIVEQAANNMPEGDYKSRDPMAMPPVKEETMVAIETLINHFLSVSWGKPIRPSEAMVSTEAPKGITGYYLISDGSAWPYGCHIRTPSFAHLQTVPMLCRDHMISDLIAILGSIDYVLADVDR